jgi:hypothetical protein
VLDEIEDDLEEWGLDSRSPSSEFFPERCFDLILADDENSVYPIRAARKTGL